MQEITMLTRDNYALFGGTFNPVHIAHLRLALEVVESLQLDFCQFLPAFTPAHKQEKILPFDFRVELLKLAIANNPKFKLSTLEQELASPSYTIQTLDYLASENRRPYFIVGLQDFRQIHTWKDGLEIAKRHKLVVISRSDLNFAHYTDYIKKNYPQAEFRDNLCKIENGTCIFLDLTKIHISSSQIRNLYLEKQDFRYLMPDNCYNYLQENPSILGKYWGK